MTGSTAPRRERKLRTRLRAGDTDALLEVYDQTAPSVYGLALRVTGLHAAAETITAEVFVQLWLRPDECDRSMPVRLSVGLLAHEHAMRWLREHRAEHRRAPHRVSEPIELTDDVRAVLQTLPAEQRIALETAFFGGNTMTETAAILGSTVPAVADHLNQALRQVTRHLSPATPQHPSPRAMQPSLSTPQFGSSRATGRATDTAR